MHLFVFLINIKLNNNRYKTQNICDEPVHNCLAALKFIPDWFVARKMLEKLDNVLNANDDILFYNEDFDKVTFIRDQRHILAADLDEINLGNDNSFDEDDSTLLFISDFWLGVVNLKSTKHLKNDQRKINANSVTS